MPQNKLKKEAKIPFKSEAQKRFLYSQKPTIAKRWAAKYGNKIMKKKKKPSKKNYSMEVIAMAGKK